MYTYKHARGHEWEDLAGSSEVTKVRCVFSLTADFDSNRITGCPGCIAPIETTPGLRLYPVVTWRGPDPAAFPADHDTPVAASLGADGAFEDAAITFTHPERMVTRRGTVARPVLERAGC